MHALFLSTLSKEVNLIAVLIWPNLEERFQQQTELIWLS